MYFRHENGVTLVLKLFLMASYCLTATNAIKGLFRNVFGDKDDSSSKDMNIDDNSCDIEHILGDAGIELYIRGDDGYEEACYQYCSDLVSLRHEINPMYVAYASSVSDVQLIISFVQNCDLIDNIAIRSGGHQYSGLSSCNGNCLQLDVSKINHFELIDFDSHTTLKNDFNFETGIIRVGPGVNVFTLTKKLSEFGLFALSGGCGDVNVGGNYQSSAHGLYMNALGAGIDFVKSYDIIKSDGSLSTITKESDPDLFWALKGGSPGAFGVVTSYDIEVFKDTGFPYNTISVTIYPYTKKNLYNILLLINELSTSDVFNDPYYAKDIGSFYFQLVGTDIDFPQLEKIGIYFVLRIWFVYTGANEQINFKSSVLYKELIKPLFRSGKYGLIPIIAQDIKIEPSVALAEAAAPWPEHQPSGYFHLIGEKVFSSKTYEIYANEVDNLINDGYYVVAQIFGFFGENSEFNTKDPYYKESAHAYRDTKMFLDTWARVKNGDWESELSKNAQNRMDKLFSDMKKTISLKDRNKKWLMYSFGERDIEKVWKDYYGPKSGIYQKLRVIKQNVDPDDIFSTPFTVPVLKDLKTRFKKSDNE